MNVRRGQGESETQELATWAVAPTHPGSPNLFSAKNPLGLGESSSSDLVPL